MDRESLEEAIRDLDRLLELDPDEGAFQKWFEKHSTVFSVLRYGNVLPHPELPGPTTYIPDFLCQRIDSLWDIVEIKRADTKVLRDRERRSSFYAEMETYLSQCHEYSEYFDDAANRERCADRHAIEVQKRPAIVLVAGRTEGLDRAKVHSLLSRRLPTVEHLTYDDLLGLLERQRVALYGGLEKLSGHSMFMVLSLDAPPPGPDDFYVLDIGHQQERNRISLRVTPERHLRLEVRDSAGAIHAVSLRESETTFQFGRFFFLSVEIGAGDGGAIVVIETNGRCCSEHRLTELRLEVDYPISMVVGSDMTGTASSSMRLAERLAYKTTLDFRARTQMQRYIFEKYKRCLADNVQPAGVRFENHTFMFTKAHRTLSSVADPTKDPHSLIQPDPDRQPFPCPADP